MKRALTLMTLAVSLMLAARADEAMVNVYGRKSVSLNGEWQALPDYMCNGHYRQVWLERKPQGKSDFYEVSFDGTPVINVPGDFNSQLDNMKYSECQVWYKREFEHVKASDLNRVFLHFGAVNYKAEVYLNGELIGTHEGGYTPFQIEVTGKVKAGPNSLIVMANNQRNADALPAQGFDWFGYGGITRDVCLVETPAAYVDDYFIALDSKSLDTVAGTIHVDGGEAVVTVDIPELKFHKTLQTAGSEATFSARLKPQLWTPDSPKLYDATLVCNGDTVRDRIGFRRIEVDGRDTRLNGKPIFLKAVNIHEETLGHPSRAWSRDHAMQHLSIAKELGCNMVRLAHYPHNEHIVRLAEEMGIMVWDEIPVYQGIAFSTDGIPEKIEAVMREMVRRDRNRCAVIVWSLSNETWDSYARRTEVLSALTDKCRALETFRDFSRLLETFRDFSRFSRVFETSREFSRLLESSREFSRVLENFRKLRIGKHQRAAWRYTIMTQQQDIHDLADLVMEYAAYMFGCGVHTARVVRCAERICQSQGATLEVMSTLQHFTATITDAKGASLTRVVPVTARKISFEANTNLSALSWRAVDQHLTIDQIRQQFTDITREPRLNTLALMVLVGIANACFCKLFGGDLTACAIVMVSTIVGFTFREALINRGVNLYIVFALSSFVASICASVSLLFNCTADIAIATSPLFLIPGVPLINGVIDILDNHILVGFSRLVSAFMLILCIAIGLSATLMFVKDNLIY